MCKIMVMAGIKEKTRSKAIRFIKEMGSKMSLGNSDGLGYAALDEDDNLFGERWLNNKAAFKYTPQHPFMETASLFSSPYSNFGSVNLAKFTAITLHTRYATCEKGLKNVHPFVKDGTSLIHNGVIYNPETYKPTISSCDSESLLNGYLEFGINNTIESLEDMVAPLRGYWATALFSIDSDKYVLDIIKHNASLDLIYIHDLEAWVMSTSGSDIESVCDKLGFTYSESGNIKDDSFIRINPQTGEVIHTMMYKKEKSYGGYNNYQSDFNKKYKDDYVGIWIKAEEKKEQDKKIKEIKIETKVHDGKSFAEFLANKKKVIV